MTTTIPRADLHAVARCHGVDYDLGADPAVDWVRGMSMGLRNACASDHGGFNPGGLLAEADDLDALADRYEQEAAT
jgi:hypothetical protein